MRRPLTKREVDLLEQRGLWEAHSYLHKIIKRLVRKRLPLEFRYIKEAHKITFTVARQPEIAGKYRRDNGPELERVDGTPLRITDWRNISLELATLDYELREATRQISPPKTEEEYQYVIQQASRLSHRLACIHPFRNGNGRSSRLLIDALLMRFGLPAVAIKKEKPRYLWAMRQADDGDFSRLEGIIIDSLEAVKRKNYELALRKKSEYRKMRHHRQEREK